VHQLVNENCDNIKMHGMTEKKNKFSDFDGIVEHFLLQ
jgi:hypothetical protein